MCGGKKCSSHKVLYESRFREVVSGRIGPSASRKYGGDFLLHKGMARGGYGAWARRALQAAELIPAKAYMTTLGDFVAVCRKVDTGAIVKIHSAADIKYNSSEAADKGEKSSVARARDGMKALDVEAFKVLAESVDTLIRAGFTTVEYWLEQPDGGEVARVDSLRQRDK